MAWAPDYATTAELKEFVRINDDADDVILAWAITAASRIIDQASNRQFGRLDAPEFRYYTTQRDRSGRWFVETDDFATPDQGDIISSIAVETESGVGGGAIDPGYFTILPRNAFSNSRPWTMIGLSPSSPVLPTNSWTDRVAINAQWGWASVPVPIKQATLMQASRLFLRRDAPFGIAGSPEAGSELRLLSKVDPDVEVMLRSYRRVWGAV